MLPLGELVPVFRTAVSSSRAVVDDSAALLIAKAVTESDTNLSWTCMPPHRLVLERVALPPDFSKSS